jgi:agmatine deiminase
MIGLSKGLKKHFPSVFNAITSCGEWQFCGTEDNIWVRDYMPVRTVFGPVQFGYRKKIKAEIVLDGGNVVTTPGKVILTDIIFRQNRHLSKRWVASKLERAFQKQLVIIPVEPFDTLGHADGIVYSITGNKLFVNDYSALCSKEYNAYSTRLIKVLNKAGFDINLIPNAYHKCPQMTERVFRRAYPMADDYNPAVGYYINYLVHGSIVLFPVFGFFEDEEVAVLLKKAYPGFILKPIPCFDLAMTGGLIHCVTYDTP